MKKKYTVERERIDYDASPGQTAYEVVKKFNHEQEAKAFYLDQNNHRQYGSLYLFMRDEEGKYHSWNDLDGAWE